jgi:hypothetical protein
MKQPDQTDQMDALLRFLPLFERSEREFIVRWGGGQDLEEGVVQMPFPIYTEEVVAFFRLASQPFWADYYYKPAEAAAMVADDAFIRQANLEQIKTMLTYCVRGERFADGYWAALLQQGRIVAILRRLRILREDRARSGPEAG